MFPGANPSEQEPRTLFFHPLSIEELAGHAKQFGFSMSHLGLEPKHQIYLCGACGNGTTGRVVCSAKRADQASVLWCLCSCERKEPTIIVEKDGMVTMQMPMAQEFPVGKNWPKELELLYEEASKAYCAGAFTATAMACRKLLMACACDKGEADGKSFEAYVDYITQKVLTYPQAKTSIDKIRNISNDANHKIAFVTPADARRAMEIVTYMLNTIYSLPAA
jgi:uncharacterized protein DUF4145